MVVSYRSFDTDSCAETSVINYHSTLRKTERAQILTGIPVSKANYLICTILIKSHESRQQINYSGTPDTSDLPTSVKAPNVEMLEKVLEILLWIPRSSS
jgi:hypothetical protein